jgi:cellulose synthase (UDP-forming)
MTTLAGTGLLGGAFFAAELVALLFTALTVFLVWRPRWRSRAPAPPAGTLDVFIPVCGEPLDLVEATIRAGLEIDWRDLRVHVLNDGRIAGKPNWEDVDALAARLGVRVWTRTEGASGKAGNLNHALARTDAEYVAVIDADHRAVRTFARETLGYFSDPDVALVTTPQQFATDARDHFNNREVIFYKLLQAAKDADNAAFSCGNAVVYRRAALSEIGGFSEWGIVEDLHTSYVLHAEGYRSVYHARALTVGLAPEEAPAFLKQRLTWASDSLRIFFRDNPLLRRGLTLRQRLHYLHTTGFYLFACLQLLFLLGPPLYLLFGIAVMRPSSTPAYAAATIPYYVLTALYLVTAAGGRGAVGCVRSVIALAPAYAVAAVRALMPKPRKAHVTPKRPVGGFSVALLPQQVAFTLLIVALWAAVAARPPGAGSAAFWAAFSAAALAPLAVGGLVRGSIGRTLGRVTKAAVVSLGVVALLPVGLLPVGSSLDASARQTAPTQLPERVAVTGAVHTAPQLRSPLPPARGVAVGAFNPTFVGSPSAMRRWEKERGVQLRIVHWFEQWGSDGGRFNAWNVRAAALAGAVPMISWEPWRKPSSGVHDPAQPEFSLASIAGGRHDRLIGLWARAAAASRVPILLRPMHEMNGYWYPWSIATNGNTPRKAVSAWRRIVRIVRAQGAHNVKFVWAVNTLEGLADGPGHDFQSFYPGDRYVDWVSVTGFNWGDTFTWSRWNSFNRIFGGTYDALLKFRKPIMISEVATVPTGGSARLWITAALTQLPRRFPGVRAIVWFDDRYPGGALNGAGRREVDFRLYGAAARAFSDAFARTPLLRAPLRTKAEPVAPKPAQPRVAAANARRDSRELSSLQSRSFSALNQMTAATRA